MTKQTAPIGYNDQGQPIEEVITTASRIRAPIPWNLILAGGALALLAWQLLDDPPHRRARRRARAR